MRRSKAAPHLILIFFTTLFFSGCIGQEELRYQGNHVEITGEKGGWTFSVNGKDFKVKGVGCGRHTSRDGTVNFLEMAKDMGANTVRTWGTDHTTDVFLEEANRLGLKVNAGLWLNHVTEDGARSYIHDKQYTNQARSEILQFIEKYKNDPAIILWGIGNETIQFTKDEKERVAFAKFLENLIQDVKKIDPHHPVIYTSAYTTGIKYIKEYVPSLDIFGINIYGGIEHAHGEIVNALDIPYIVSEFGPIGPWDQGNDINGKPVEQTDDAKSNLYQQRAQTIKKFEGYHLGAFVFLIGDTTQNSLTWWNLNHGAYPKHSYLVMQRFYTGKDIKHTPPSVRQLVLSKTKDLAPGEPFDINVIVRSPEDSRLKFDYFASTDVVFELEEFPNAPVKLNWSGQGSKAKAEAPQEPGIYRIYALVVDQYNQASTLSKTISVTK